MAMELKSRTPLSQIINLPIDENIFVKIYDTNYGVNIKIYQKHQNEGTELFVNADVDKMQIPNIKDNYDKAIFEYIRKHIHLTMDYEQEKVRYLVALRQYRK